MSSLLDQEWAAFVRDGMLPAAGNHSPALPKLLPPSPRSHVEPEKERTDYTSRSTLKASDEPAGIPPLTISTQSNNAKLNRREEIDVWQMFWALRIMPYNEPSEGVIKKQIKVQCATREELASLKTRVAGIPSHAFSKVEHIDEPGNVTPFRYVAKLSIGLASKEVKAHRAQEKNAFFNSFTMVLRVRYKGSFKEIVTKVFNRNVLSLPGMLDAELRTATLSLIDRMLGETSMALDASKPPLRHLPGTITGVMVNSNFWCGFGLDRDKVVALMRDRYGLEASYDPTTYPGVICRYYQPNSGCCDGRCPCNPPCSTLRIGDKKGKARKTNDIGTDEDDGASSPGRCQKLTFMLFRTGSVLIVGRCEQDLLDQVHRFVATLLIENRRSVEGGNGERPNKKEVRKKSRRRIAWVLPESDSKAESRP